MPGEWINNKYNIKKLKKNKINSDVFPWHEIPDNMPNIYNKSIKTFCVVRDPYTKIVSAYNYWRGKNGSKNDLNKFINYNLSNVENNPEKLWFNSGHILPQNLYTHGKNKCDYILRFENLEEEFNDLMRKFNIKDIKLEKNNKSSKNVCIKDLTLESRKLIQKVYKKDFELFNYPM